MPPLVDGVELRDGRVVVTVLQGTDLHLVNAFELERIEIAHAADLGGRLRGAHRDAVRHHPDLVGPVAGDCARLFTTEVGELPTRRAGVQPSLHVAVRLAVPDEYQP